MKKISLTSDGFTAIELLVFILVLTMIAVVGFTNIRSIRAENRDTTRKTDVNAVYYQLENFYEKSGYYPEKLDSQTLAGIDPESLKDSDNLTFNDQGGSYSYKPINCSEAKCKSYTISANLEKEAVFSKESLNR